jgi:death-on-curing protein
MIRYLTLSEVLYLHDQLINQSGGTVGLRDIGLLESAIAQPRVTFAGIDLYPSLIDKAVALGFCLINNHPFIDGNKRLAHASIESFLILNGIEIYANVDEQEEIILSLAAGKLKRSDFLNWLHEHTKILKID